MLLLVGTLGLTLHFVGSHVRALESDLKSALKHVSYYSKGLERRLAEVAAKYQKGFSKPNGAVNLDKCLGSSPMSICAVGLLTDKFNADETYDQANFAIWPTQTGTAVQFLDGMSEAGDRNPSWLVGDAYRSGNRLVRCGDATRLGNRWWPAARIYRLKGRLWKIVANEEFEWPFGTAAFKRANGRVLTNTVVTHTAREVESFSDKVSGWRLGYSQNWYIHGDRFVVGRDVLDQDPLAELVRLARLAKSGKRAAFDAGVPSLASAKLWNVLCKEFRALPDGGRGYDSDAFLLVDIADDTVLKCKVVFARSHGRWRVAHVTGK